MISGGCIEFPRCGTAEYHVVAEGKLGPEGIFQVSESSRFPVSGLRHAEAATAAQAGVSIQVEYWKTYEDDRHQQALLHIVVVLVLVVVLENRLTPDTIEIA